MLAYIDEVIVKSEPTFVEKTTDTIAIVVHVFYIDVWKEIIGYLLKLDMDYDLYVTVPECMADSDIKSMISDYPDMHIYMTENRGRDVLPFLQIMNIIGLDSYQYICKLHTKKTGDSPLGNVWRKLLYFDLLGSNKIVKKIISIFKNDKSIGMVTGKNTILDSERYDYGNTVKIDTLVDNSGFTSQNQYLFAGGTMFWIRAELIEPILNLFQSGALNFESEKGQKDNTLAHAIERFFGIICQLKYKKIVESPAKYSKLDDKVLNEVAALVLSQQYVGEDVFISQKHEIQLYRNSLEFKEKEIQTKDKEVLAYSEAVLFKEKELEVKDKEVLVYSETVILKDKEINMLLQNTESLTQQAESAWQLAESLRLKNRFKRLLPSSIMAQVQRIIQLATMIKHNPSVLKKVMYYIKRGEFEYLNGKIEEKCEKNLVETSSRIKIDPSIYFEEFKEKKYLLADTIVDIIIPVYNGYEYLEALFDSLEKHTTSSHRLIVIDDCSPDLRVKPYLLKRLQSHPSNIFIEHENNLGFVKSVNEGYSHTTGHFVLLNTDTELPAFWMERLMYPLLHMNKIASTTPFTNSGQIASFPEFIADNDIFEGMSVNNLDKIFRNVNAENFYEAIPTGVGFCMGVNYNLVQQIGFFEEEAFGRGYGEENDWCQRAIGQGYQNLLVPNLFVYHKHGGSFSAEDKASLMQENAIKLLDKHPNYDKDIQAYVKKDPHAILRHMLVLVASSKGKEGLYLVVDHALGGGANLYSKSLLKNLRQEEKKILHLTFDFYSNSYNLSFSYKNYTFDFSIETMKGVEVLLKELIFAEIFVNSLVSFKETSAMLILLRNLTEMSNARLIIPIHDYYPLCPNYTLLNEQSEFCEVPDLERCKQCMAKNDLEWKTFGNANTDVSTWRNNWNALLENATEIICFSNSSQEIFKRAYNNLDEKKIKVVPHSVPFLPPVIMSKKEKKEKITVGVLGAINIAKGAGILKELLREIEKRDLKINIVLIGEISESPKSDHFLVTGRYERKALPALVQSHEIDIFLIPSICPETFSYTTQEIIMMDMPLMVFNLGAPAERVKLYEKGIVLEKDYVSNIIQKLTEFFLEV